MPAATALPSTIPAMKTNLLAILRARPALASPVQVSWGALPEQMELRQLVILGDVENTETWASIGQLRKWEEYRLTVWISVVLATRDHSEAAGRAWALQQELALALRADPTVGGALSTITGWCRLSGAHEVNRADGTNCETQIEQYIDCKARI